MKLYRQEGTKVELCIPGRLENEINELFEEEIQDGHREELADGRIYLVLEITREKAILLNLVAGWMDHGGRETDTIRKDGQKNAS